jgi:predicted Rossmann fold flavoprotein
MECERIVAVVGGGASGMMAAIAAAETGVPVTIIEKNQRLGKKLLATGNGRCNLANVNLSAGNYHGCEHGFVLPVLARFGLESTLDFFERIGVHHMVEDGGRVFPLSEQAGSVLDVLRWRLEELGVTVVLDSPVFRIGKGRRGYVLEMKGGKSLEAERVILATGGMAAPQLGADKSGLDLARLMGHRLVKPFPALVPLKLSSKDLKGLKGVKFKGEASIVTGESEIRKEAGELLFTEYGISGPPVLSLSRDANRHLLDGLVVMLRLDLFPHWSFSELEEIMTRRLELGKSKSLAFSMVGFVNKKMIPFVLRESGIGDIHVAAGELTPEEVHSLVKTLKKWSFEVTGSTSWPNAQVAAGGVDARDIDPETMESRLSPGLYFSGEMVDVDGDCGGYNLQWAWSSGHLAGTSAGKSCLIG